LSVTARAFVKVAIQNFCGEVTEETLAPWRKQAGI
jgi:hypothetical protein